MSNEAQSSEQSTSEPFDDLALDKETLKDLDPRSEDQDNVRGGAGSVIGGTQLCNVKAGGATMYGCIVSANC